MAGKRNWWLTGIFGFAGTIFGLLAFISYRAYVVRDDNYYLISALVYGGVALTSLVAVVAGWTNRLPGQRRAAPPAEATDPDGPAAR